MWNKVLKKIVSFIVVLIFLSTSISPGSAQILNGVSTMPAPGNMVGLTTAFTPAHLVGLTLDPANALKFDFIIHKGDEPLPESEKPVAYRELIKYFLAALTIPDNDQWVNLSPYEGSRIIQDDFGMTEMGRDLLTQDYILKQLTASLLHPDSEIGKKFWAEVYKRSWEKYGTTEIPVDTFNKVWIVPDKAVVFEKGQSALIVESHLKVMTESDYLAQNEGRKDERTRPSSLTETQELGKQVVKEVIIPVLEREVNEGKNFANLRQIVSAMILATWYKKALRESLLGKIYADKSKVKGVDQDPANNQKIWEQYVEAFKKGAFNMIREDYDRFSEEMIPRKYFSGGFDPNQGRVLEVTHNIDAAQSVVIAAQQKSIDTAMVSLDQPGRAMPAGADVTRRFLVDVADPQAVREGYQKAFPVAERALLTEELFRYYTALRQRVNPSGGGTVIYGGSGIDIVNVLLATMADEVFMLDNYNRVDQNMLEFWRDNYRPGDLQSLDAKELNYLQNKKKDGYSHVDGIQDPVELMFSVELQSLGISPDKDKIEVHQNEDGVMSISFEKDWPGIGIRRHTIHFVDANITQPETYPGILKEKLRAKEVRGYFQNAGMHIAENYADFLPAIVAGFKDGKGFVVTDDYIGNDRARQVSSAEVLSQSGLKEIKNLSPDVDRWVQEELTRREQKGYGWRHSILEIAGDAAMSVRRSLSVALLAGVLSIGAAPVMHAAVTQEGSAQESSDREVSQIIGEGVKKKIRRLAALTLLSANPGESEGISAVGRELEESFDKNVEMGFDERFAVKYRELLGLEGHLNVQTANRLIDELAKSSDPKKREIIERFLKAFLDETETVNSLRNQLLIREKDFDGIIAAIGSHASPFVRARAVLAVAWANDRQDVRAGILKALNDPDDRVRWVAAYYGFRGQESDPGIVQALLERLGTEQNPAVREKIIGNFLKLKLDRDYPAVKEALLRIVSGRPEKDPGVRRIALIVLSNRGDMPIEAALNVLIGDSSSEVRVEAAKALQDLVAFFRDGDGKYSIVAQALKDKFPAVRLQVVQFLRGQVGRNDKIAQALLEALNDESDWQVRGSIILSLSELDSGHALGGEVINAALDFIKDPRAAPDQKANLLLNLSVSWKAKYEARLSEALVAALNSRMESRFDDVLKLLVQAAMKFSGDQKISNAVEKLYASRYMDDMDRLRLLEVWGGSGTREGMKFSFDILIKGHNYGLWNQAAKNLSLSSRALEEFLHESDRLAILEGIVTNADSPYGKVGVVLDLIARYGNVRLAPAILERAFKTEVDADFRERAELALRQIAQFHGVSPRTSWVDYYINQLTSMGVTSESLTRLKRAAKAGIEMPVRFDGETLDKLLDFREAPQNSLEDVHFFVYTRADQKGAFFQTNEIRDSLARGKAVLYYEAYKKGDTKLPKEAESNNGSIYYAIQDVRTKIKGRGSVSHVFLGAHSGPLQMLFGTGDSVRGLTSDDPEYRLTVNDNKFLTDSGLSYLLSDNVRFVIVGCSTGAGREKEMNIANFLKEFLRQNGFDPNKIKVFAPTIPSGDFQLIYDGEGNRIEGVEILYNEKGLVYSAGIYLQLTRDKAGKPLNAIIFVNDNKVVPENGAQVKIQAYYVKDQRIEVPGVRQDLFWDGKTVNFKTTDSAQYGGIDLNQVNMDMQIRRDGAGVPLPLNRQDLEHINIDGLVPTILEIRPVINLPMLSDAAVKEPAASHS